jgi:hypothetical protein
MKRDDDFKRVVMDHSNKILSILSKVSMPEKDRYKDWRVFSAHGTITSMYSDPLYSQERLNLQKSHFKLLLYAFVRNFDEIFQIPENLDTIKAILKSLEHILEVDHVYADDIVPAANSITMLTKLTKPADI